MTSSAGRSTGVSHAGQRSGMWNSRSAPVRLSGSGRTTWGITSPARMTSTWSPIRMSFCAMRSSLCRVAALTLTPEISTGASTAHGLSAPVRPTLMRMSSTRVTATSGANFRAIAQRGSRPPTTPSSPWRSRRSTLMTTPSAWKGRRGRSSSKLSIAFCTSASVSNRWRWDSTWKPQPARRSSSSMCVGADSRPVTGSTANANIRSRRRRVRLGSSCRRPPAAALRGLAKSGSPSCSRCWFTLVKPA